MTSANHEVPDGTPDQGGRPTRLGFLVYDSRSGSTYLASRLNMFAGVSVSHESRFIATILEFSATVDTAEGLAALADVLFYEPHFAELGWTRQGLIATMTAVPAPRSRKSLIEALVAEYFTARDPGARLRVVKSGRSVYHARVLREYFPDAFFIHVVRDGRAVHVSKLAARSTAGRMMTDNVVRSAREWLLKLRIMRLHEEVTLNVRFEDLMQDPEPMLERIATFLDLSTAEKRQVKSAANYARDIGGRQQHLHGKVGKALDTSRADAWRSEMDPLDARVYDRLAQDELRRWGYLESDPEPATRAQSVRIRARLGWLRLVLTGQSARRLWGYATREHSVGRRLRGKAFELRATKKRGQGLGGPMRESEPAQAGADRLDEYTVSLVIPLYNSAGFIDAALASVAGQSRLPDEIIVVDDASTDDGAARAAKWSDRLPLTVVTQPVNQGPGVARRVGIAASSCDLISLLDADDVLFPDHLDVLLNAYHQHGGVITADTLWWAPNKQLSLVTGRRRKRVPSPGRQRLGILEHNFVHPISVFSRADYDSVGGFSDLRKMEDWDLWIRMIRAGVQVRMAPLPTALYRVHGGSASAGRGDLSVNVEVLPGYLADLAPDERRVLQRTIRRRQARIDLLAGERQAELGEFIEASRLWARAVVRDRRFRGGLTGGRSSVTLQALANLASAGRLSRMRRARAGSAGIGLRQR